MPAGLSLNTSTGVISGTPTAAGAYSFTVTATDSSGTPQTSSQTYSGTIAAAPSITTTTLPTPILTQSYSQTIGVSGGTAPYTCAVTGGTLPAGLSLDTSTCTISGTPTAAGAYSFTVTATDANGLTASQSYSGSIAAGPTITTATLPTPVLSQSYSQTVATSGGTGPIAFSISSGSLPAGLTLNTSTGQITGTPTTPGAYSFTVTATDANGLTASQAYSGTIASGLTITTTTLPTPTISQPYSQTISTSGGTAPVTCAITSGALPAGLSLNTSTCQITGTPTNAGAYSFTVTATDANGVTASQGYSGTIAPIAITTTSITQPVSGEAYSQTISVAGGTGGITYTVSAGSLPAGLSLNPTTGVISGTPTTPGPYSFTVKATDSNGSSASQTYSGNVTGKTVSSVTLAASSTSIEFGKSVTLTATVTGNNPTGTVQFIENGSVLGTGTISGGKATLVLSNLTLGAHSIIASYGGDTNNRSAVSSSVALTVRRPNPADDPNVRALVTAQIMAANQLARAQIGNIARRIEQIHDAETACEIGDRRDRIQMQVEERFCINFVNGIGVQQRQANRDTASANPAAETTKGMTSNTPQTQSALGASGTSVKQATTEAMQEQKPRELVGKDNASNASPASWFGNDGRLVPVNVWAAGSVIFGKYTPDGMLEQNKFTTGGLTFGVDTRLFTDFKAGVAIGYGTSSMNLNRSQAKTDATSVTGMLYGSYQIVPSLFLDGMVGYSGLNFENSRWSNYSGSLITGNRSAGTWFGSIGLTSEQRIDQFRFAPYVRFDLINTRFASANEKGDPNWTLHYAAASSQSFSAVVGLRGSYDFLFDWGRISPTARVEYYRLLDGNSVQVLSYVADAASQYPMFINGQGQNMGLIGLGLNVDMLSGLGAGLEYLYAASSQTQSQGLRGLIRMSF